MNRMFKKAKSASTTNQKTAVANIIQKTLPPPPSVTQARDSLPSPLPDMKETSLKHWPPAKLGMFPDWQGAPALLNITQIDLQAPNGTPISGLTYSLDNPEDNRLLEAWSASLRIINGNMYLELPKLDVKDLAAKWIA